MVDFNLLRNTEMREMRGWNDEKGKFTVHYWCVLLILQIHYSKFYVDEIEITSTIK